MSLAVHRSSKLIPDFVLHRPETIEDAVALAGRYGGAAAFMAGGVSLINGMKTGTGAGNVIHLGRLPGFDVITQHDDRLRIGAGATLWQLQMAPELAVLPQAVRHAITQIGNVRVRVKGTIGGNIMAREANYDVLPIAMALGADLCFAAPDGGTTLHPAIEHLPANQLLLSLSVPVSGTWFGYDRTMRPFITMAVGIEPAREIRVGIACAYPQAYGATIPISSMTPAALGAAAADLARDWAAALPEPVSDATASGRYRRRLAGVLLRRQIEAFARTATLN
jgi:carbon-monoxide dehydrogenase medium subunit